MGRLMLAVRAFWRALTSAAAAGRIRQALEGPPQPTAPPPAPPSPAAPPSPPTGPRRSEAITLLAALQREGRLVDFLKEPIAGYTDAQVGAAVREIHRACGQVLDAALGLEPILDQQEGEAVTVPAGYDPARLRLTGNVAGEPPHQGRLVHHGWRATRCQLPQWTGAEAAATVVSPAEVELR